MGAAEVARAGVARTVPGSVDMGDARDVCGRHDVCARHVELRPYGMRLTRHEACLVVPVITATAYPVIEFRARSRLYADGRTFGTAREARRGQPDMP